MAVDNNNDNNNNNNNNDKKKYDIVKIPPLIRNWINCNEKMCIKVCKRPRIDDNDKNKNNTNSEIRLPSLPPLPPSPPKQPQEPSLQCDIVCLVRATEPSPWQWNPLRNYAIVVKNEESNSIDKRAESGYQINLGEQLDKVGKQAGHVAQVSYEASKGYIDSWKDGTQASFFRRVYEISTDKDQLQMLQDHAKKTIDIFWNGNDGNNKKKKEEENNNSNDKRDDKNDKDNNNNNNKDD